MKTIELHGILRTKFGRFFKLDVQSAKEASHALSCLLPEFKRFMLDSERLGYRFAVFAGKKRTKKTNIGEQDLNNITTANHIHIVPRVMGSGGKTMGWLQTIAGVALVVGGVATQQWHLVGAGVGLLIGGVTSLLMPTPNIDKNDDDKNRPNNGFGGAVTTIAQGNPVPVLYGCRQVGGFICSAGIYAEDK